MADSTSKTVRVHLVVYVDTQGNYEVHGGKGRIQGLDHCATHVEIDAPLPSAPTVEGEVAGEEVGRG